MTDFEEKKTIVLDGDLINDKLDFHKAISDALDFGPHYGNNTNALWDMLSGGIACGYTIVWKKSDISQKKINQDFEKIIKVFEMTKILFKNESSQEQFDYILE